MIHFASQVILTTRCSKVVTLELSTKVVGSHLQAREARWLSQQKDENSSIEVARVACVRTVIALHWTCQLMPCSTRRNALQLFWGAWVKAWSHVRWDQGRLQMSRHACHGMSQCSRTPLEGQESGSSSSQGWGSRFSWALVCTEFHWVCMEPKVMCAAKTAMFNNNVSVASRFSGSTMLWMHPIPPARLQRPHKENIQRNLFCQQFDNSSGVAMLFPGIIDMFWQLMQFHMPPSCEWGVFYLAQAELGKAAKCLEEVRLVPLNQVKTCNSKVYSHRIVSRRDVWVWAFKWSSCMADISKMSLCGGQCRLLSLQSTTYILCFPLLESFRTLEPWSLSAFHFSRISKHWPKPWTFPIFILKSLRSSNWQLKFRSCSVVLHGLIRVNLQASAF